MRSSPIHHYRNATNFECTCKFCPNKAERGLKISWKTRFARHEGSIICRYPGQSAKTADWLENNDVKWLFSRNCACANSKDSKWSRQWSIEVENNTLAFVKFCGKLDDSYPGCQRNFFFKVGENTQRFQINSRGQKRNPLVARPQNLISMRRNSSDFSSNQFWPPSWDCFPRDTMKRIIYKHSWKLRLQWKNKIKWTEVMAIHFNSCNNFRAILTMLYWF